LIVTAFSVGSALDSHAYSALLGEEKAAAVFTDPPYNVRVGSGVM